VKPIGHQRWAISAGAMPVHSTGEEPEFTSHDRLAILNAGDADASVELQVVHADRDPVGPYELEVAARRVRSIRINDLIDPEAVPLGEPYGLVVRSDQPVVVQFSRQDTRQAANAGFMALAHPSDA
jgi:hypothetical protein